jgi:hypothetical protein
LRLPKGRRDHLVRGVRDEEGRVAAVLLNFSLHEAALSPAPRVADDPVDVRPVERLRRGLELDRGARLRRAMSWLNRTPNARQRRRTIGFVAIRTSKQSPDYLLAEDGFLALNQTLYAAAPQDYFDRRLMNLGLVASKRSELDSLLEDGFEYGDLKVGPGSGDEGTTDEAEAEKTAAHFVTAEAEVLGHHVGETLLRLYLAHAWAKGDPLPGCPWLELSRLRAPSEFKQRVASRFVDAPYDDANNLAALARVFYLTDKPEGIKPSIDVARWSKSLESIESYLRAFAAEFLDRAPLYNAAKHGFAVTPTEFGVKFKGVIDTSGPAVRYLEARELDAEAKKRGDRLFWWEAVHWVRADLRMLLIRLGCELIQLLWDAARFRYVPSYREAGFNLRLFERPRYDELLVMGREGGGIDVTDMSMQLLYYKEPETAE